MRQKTSQLSGWMVERYFGIELRKNIYGLDNYGIGKIQWKS